MAAAGQRIFPVTLFVGALVLGVSLFYNADLYAKLDTPEAIDLGRYLEFYLGAQLSDYSTTIAGTRFETGFASLAWAFSQTGLDFWWFALALKIMLLGSYVALARRALGGVALPALATALFVGFAFEAYSTNVMRQGASLSFVFVTYIFLMDGRWKVATAYGLVAILLHNTAILFVSVGFFAAQRVWRVPLGITFFAAVGALGVYAGNGWVFLSDRILGVLSSFGLYYSVYGNMDTPYVIGFKLTFFVASSAVVFACAGLMTRRWPGPAEAILMRVALLITCAYLMTSGFPYYDRLGSISWMLAPILLCLNLRPPVSSLAARGFRPRQSFR